MIPIEEHPKSIFLDRWSLDDAEIRRHLARLTPSLEIEPGESLVLREGAGNKGRVRNSSPFGRFQLFQVDLSNLPRG